MNPCIFCTVFLSLVLSLTGTPAAAESKGGNSWTQATFEEEALSLPGRAFGLFNWAIRPKHHVLHSFSQLIEPPVARIVDETDQKIADANGLALSQSRVTHEGDAQADVTDVVMGRKGRNIFYWRIGHVRLFPKAKDLIVPDTLPLADRRQLLIVPVEALDFIEFNAPLIAAMERLNLNGLIGEDLGIGRGLLSLIALQSAQARRMIGVDRSSLKLQEAAEMLRGHGDQVVLVHSDLKEYLHGSYRDARVKAAGGPIEFRIANIGDFYADAHNEVLDMISEETLPVTTLLGGYMETHQGHASAGVLNRFSDGRWKIILSRFQDYTAITLIPSSHNKITRPRFDLTSRAS